MPESPPLVMARDDIVRLTLHGDRAPEVLNGLVSNEVAALEPGRGCYAVALNPKGKIVADLIVLRAADRVHTETTREAGPGWVSTVRKYVNPRLAKSSEDTHEIDVVELVGDGATSVARGVTGISSLDVGDYGHVECALAGATVRIARLALYRVEGFRITAAKGMGPAIVDALQQGGAAPGTVSDLEVRRVEAGWPRWGRDMDEGTLSQEANMDALDAISFTKGCYTGQEYVARLHFRGHVNRSLRGLMLDRPVPAGASLRRDDGTTAGDVRSVVASSRFGDIALAMVRREVESGTTLRAQWDGGDAGARVVDLPFSS